MSMLQWSNKRHPLHSASRSLLRAINANSVTVDLESKSATITAPSNPETLENLTDDDWLQILRTASELRNELKSLGFQVQG